MRPAFRKLENGETVPIGYQSVNCHLIFDFKIEDFCCKARMVAGRHTTNTSSTITYAGAVLRETVRITFILAALNNLPVKVGDIQNAYITLPITETVFTVRGHEFGEDTGRNLIFIRAIFGIKISGPEFWKHRKTVGIIWNS